MAFVVSLLVAFGILLIVGMIVIEVVLAVVRTIHNHLNNRPPRA